VRDPIVGEYWFTIDENERRVIVSVEPSQSKSGRKVRFHRIGFGPDLWVADLAVFQDDCRPEHEPLAPEPPRRSVWERIMDEDVV
jgi:hypothetical protein